MARLLDLLRGMDADVDEQEFVAKKSANVILYIIGGFFVLLLLWATFTTVDRTVRGMGRVIPSSKLQVVSNLEGGVVEEILVKIGQSVRKGDVIVRLSPTMTGAAFGSSSVEVEALQAKIIRLNAEVRGETPDFTNVSPNQAQIESALFAARKAELNGIVSAGSARINQAQRSVAQSQSMVEARRSNLETSRQELEMLLPLADTQIIAKVDLIKAENAARVAQNEYDAALAALARSRAEVAEASATTAQQKSDWLSRAGNELSLAQAELAAKQEQLPALSDRMERTIIRAPLSGKVNRVLVTTVGGSVAAGEPIAEIVPSDDALYIEAMIRPSDIGNVRLGQKSKVEITAYNPAVFGSLQGTVTSISPDAVVVEESGESFYNVEVQTTDKLRDSDGKVLEIGPGMIANVNLLGEKRSILSYLFTPITRLSETAFRE